MAEERTPRQDVDWISPPGLPGYFTPTCPDCDWRGAPRPTYADAVRSVNGHRRTRRHKAAVLDREDT